MRRSNHRRPWGRMLLGWVLAATLAWSQVRVTPGAVVLLPGETCAFQARPAGPEAKGRLLAGGGGLAAAWSLAGDAVGALDPLTGAYTSPEVAEPALVRILARTAAGAGEATLLVLPREPFAVIARVLGGDWLPAYSSRLPFLDPAAGLRFQPGSRVLDLPGLALRPVRVAHGLPATLEWPAVGDAIGQLLSYRDGDQLVRKEVTGKSSEVLVATGRIRDCSVEILRRLAPGGFLEGFSSRRVQLPVRVLGLVGLAGNPLAEPGHQDGQGLAARFREPFGLAEVKDGKGVRTLLADAGSHALRLVDPEGGVRTLAGDPGQPGHRDRQADGGGWRSWLWFKACGKARADGDLPARFNRPTFVLAKPLQGLGKLHWEAVVADTGNHVLRMVHPDGSVGTLAGLPEVAGHHDADDPREARFHEPMGLAWDALGNLYVADRGNRVIRRISRSGRVTTIAGSPGLAGTQDGVGDQARFTDPQGLAMTSGTQDRPSLTIADGHALRSLDLASGRVTTILGRVGEAGFREIPEHGDPLLPCLNGPCGLSWRGQELLIADRGNHALRIWDAPLGSLATLAGDPQCPESRWGLLRLGLEGALDERFAALEAPRAMIPAYAADGSALVLVASGRALGELRADLPNRDMLATPVRLHCPARIGAEPCRVRFRVDVVDSEGLPTHRNVHYCVRFLEPDGREAQRCEGMADSLAEVEAAGSFSQRGQGRVVLQCVTDQGVPARIEQVVMID